MADSEESVGPPFLFGDRIRGGSACFIEVSWSGRFIKPISRPCLDPRQGNLRPPPIPDPFPQSVCKRKRAIIFVRILA